MASILDRVAPEKISAAWVGCLTFAIYVVGSRGAFEPGVRVSGSVRVWDLMKFITPEN